jgi:hypothetical protein
MPLIVKGTDGEFTPAPPGLHQAVCVDVVDLGMVDGKYGPKRQAKIVWQLKTRNEKNERFQVRATYTQSLHEKARLRHDLESWRGRPFTREEIRGFDLETVIGANCQIQVAHRVSAKGRTYANAQAIVPLAKGMEKLQPENYEREPWPDPEDIIEGSPVDEPAPLEADDPSCPF